MVSKTDVVLFVLSALQWLLMLTVYVWPAVTIVMWIRWWNIRRTKVGYWRDRADNALFIAGLMTAILIVVGAYLFWISLPDTRPVVSMNAR